MEWTLSSSRSTQTWPSPALLCPSRTSRYQHHRHNTTTDMIVILCFFYFSPVSRIWSWQQRGLHWDVPDYDQKRGRHCAGAIWSVFHGLHTDHIVNHLIASFREKTFPATVSMWWWWWKQKMRLVADPCVTTLSVPMSCSTLAIAPRSLTSWFLRLSTVNPNSGHPETWSVCVLPRPTASPFPPQPRCMWWECCSVWGSSFLSTCSLCWWPVWRTSGKTFALSCCFLWFCYRLSCWWEVRSVDG